MTIDNQVCSILQGVILKELGITQNPNCSAFVHVVNAEYSDNVTLKRNIHSLDITKERIALFTTAELGELIPAGYVLPHKKADGFWWYQCGEKRFGLTEANARAALLINLLRSKEITIEQVNENLCK